MSKKELQEKQILKKTKRNTAKKLSVSIVLVAVAILGYKLWENPKLVYQMEEFFKSKADEDVYQVQINALQQQILSLQGQLADVAMKAENPDFSAMNKRIDDIEQISVNTIKSKANVDTVLGLVVRMDNAEGKINDLAKVTNDSALILTAAMLVKDAGIRGGKFVYEAEVLNELAAGNYKISKEVARLNEIATVGVPSVEELQESFARVYVSKYPEAPQDEERPATNWKERIYNQLHKVVRIKNTDDNISKEPKKLLEEDRAWSIVRDFVLDGEVAKALAIIDKPINKPMNEDKLLAEWKQQAEIYRDFYDSINKISANALAVMKVDFLKNKE